MTVLAVAFPDHRVSEEELVRLEREYNAAYWRHGWGEDGKPVWAYKVKDIPGYYREREPRPRGLVRPCYVCGRADVVVYKNRTEATVRFAHPSCWQRQRDRERDEAYFAPLRADVAYLCDLPYQEYLQTEHWRETRAGALRRAGRQCEECGSKEKLHVHHLTYERRGRELPGDLRVLCEAHHKAVHGIP